MAAQRIMLIDNEIGLCRMMEAVLKDQGYQVKSFTRPVQAVAEFSAGDYDLIISDIKMPEMDGLEVLQHVRNRDPEVPVIMITAYATVEMSIQALRRGAYDMLTKPFEPDELTYRVKNALQHHRLVEENRELREEPYTTTPPVATIALSPSTAALCRRTSWRVSSSATARERLPGRLRTARACSKPPMAARCFSTKSATCRSIRRRACCAFCRSRSSAVWATPRPPR